MAITLVQTVDKVFGASTGVVMGNTTSGNTMIVVVGDNSNSSAVGHVSTITDSQGNTYVQAVGVAQSTNTNCEIWYAKNITGGTTPTVTITLSAAATENGVIVREYSGLDTISPLDQTNSGAGTTGATLSSSATSTTTQANELVVAGGVQTNGTSSWSLGSGYGNLDQKSNAFASNVSVAAEDQTVSSTGTYTGTFGWSGSNGSWCVVIATFKAATAGPRVSFLGSTFNTTSGTHTVTAVPALNDLIVIIRANTGNTTSTAPTDNNSSGTYNLVVNALKNSSADLMEIYVRTALIGSATSTVFTDAAGTTTGGGIAVYKVSGVTNINAAVRQVAAQANHATGAAPAPTFAAAALTSSVIISGVFDATNPPALTAKSGYTRDVNAGYATPTSGVDTMSVATGETGTAITWGSSAGSAFCSVAIEIANQTAVPLHSQIFKGTAGPVTLSWTPTPGNLLVVGMTYNSNTGPATPTDNQTGNTYVSAGTANDASGGNTGALYYSILVGSSGTFTITATEPTGGDFVVAEYHGYGAPGAKNTGTGSGSQPTINLVTGGAASLIVGLQFDEAATINQQTPIVANILEQFDTDNSADERIALMDQVGNAATYAIGLHDGYSGSWAVVAAEFLVPAAGNSGAGFLALL